MSRELLQQALMGDYPQLIAAVRQYLAQPAQEPVAWAMLRADGLVLDVICPDERDAYQGEYTVPLYAAPAAPAAPAVPAVPAVPAWLPIESAPYGAGEVIAVNRDGGISLQAGNHLRDLIQAAQEDGDYCWHTHWMPPPAAPGSAPAAPAVPAVDCRTCARCYATKGRGVYGCDSVVGCTNGDRYQPLPPVKLWRAA